MAGGGGVIIAGAGGGLGERGAGGGAAVAGAGGGVTGFFSGLGWTWKQKAEIRRRNNTTLTQSWCGPPLMANKDVYSSFVSNFLQNCRTSDYF